MDDIVKQALAKWPNVPHCYGWLALDARGAWRMRDEAAQAQGLPGDRIAHAALVGFINRNYQADEQGRWYFQNGPQRVYVHLEATPYITRTDPEQGFVLQTGEPLPAIDDAWMTEAGELILQGQGKAALVDDRDMAQCLPLLQMAGKPAADEQLLAWIEQGPDAGQLMFNDAGRLVPVQPIARAGLAEHFGFDPAPKEPNPA